jgi:hypothetical protein
MDSELITFISQFGFPIAVATFVLLRMESTIKRNTEAITALKEEIIRSKEKE